MRQLGFILLGLLIGFPPLQAKAQEIPTQIQGPETQPSQKAVPKTPKSDGQKDLKLLQSDLQKIAPDHSGTLNLSFDQVIQLGILNNIRTLISREGINIAKGEYLRSLSGILPNLSSNVNQTRRTSNLIAEGIDPTVFPGISPGAFGPYNNFDARISVVQNIFDLAAIGTVQAGSSKKRRSQFKFAMTKHLVFKKAGEAYVNVQKYQGDVASGEADYKLAKTLFEMTVVAFQAGVVTGVDKARAEARMLESETKLLQAKTQLAKAQNELKGIILIPMGTQLNLTDPLGERVEPLPNTNQAVEIAQTNRPDIKAAKETIRMAGYEHRAAIGMQVPSLAFGANYGGSGNTPTQNVAGTYQLGALIQIPIFDGGNTIGEIKVTKSQKRQAQYLLSSLRQQADKEVRDALDAMKYSSQEIIANRKRVQVAEIELELTRDRFFEGVSDNLELVKAQTTLADARDSYIQALATYNTARIELAYALGIIQDFKY